MKNICKSTAVDVASVLIEGFNKHYLIFQKVSSNAKFRFQERDWLGQQSAQRERIDYYDLRVRECIDLIGERFCVDDFGVEIWHDIKLEYIGFLINHLQPELAETFFNSVVTKILKRSYYNNKFLFVRPVISTSYIEDHDLVKIPAYFSWYPGFDDLEKTFFDVVGHYSLGVDFFDLSSDISLLANAFRKRMVNFVLTANFQLQILSGVFYRNKGAYLIGKIINGYAVVPFAIPVVYGEDNLLRIDAVLFGETDLYILFSFARAYFMVDMEVPSAYVEFLRSLMPHKPRAEIYSTLGLAKQGKTLFYRDFLHHLNHSTDKFRVSPGIRGMVMLVFDLPSFPYVFKIIKDFYPSQKNTTRTKIKDKYLLVKQHDRVGRMADTLEYSDVAFPIHRFDDGLLDEIKKFSPSQLEINTGEKGYEVVIKHLYIERRMVPLNVYLQDALMNYEPGNAYADKIEAAVLDYGNAIKELIAANIFPGDMLWKNFGVTGNGRVVFYDYDEIEYLTDCNFRSVPESRYEEDEMSGEVWYSVAANDVFPETFAPFLLGNDVIKAFFMKHHADLLKPDLWIECQKRIKDGIISDIFPYSQNRRFGIART